MDELAHLNIVYPMMFELVSQAGIKTHCGVLEFSAEEGRMYIPYWMMQHLRLSPGQILSIKSASLKKGSYVKLRPQTKDFIEEISNPKAVLEAKLRNFATLTAGDTIMINYNKKNYCIDILECKASDANVEAISVIDTDVQVDFDRPADMPDSPVRERPTPKSPPGIFPSAPLTFGNDHLHRKQLTTTPGAGGASNSDSDTTKTSLSSNSNTFQAFQGTGRTLKGTIVPPGCGCSSSNNATTPALLPPSSRQSSEPPSSSSANVGGGMTTTTSSAHQKKDNAASLTTSTNSFTPFAGTGRTLSGKSGPPPQR
jgi:ubiquitin fusion degradation protein 1